VTAEWDSVGVLNSVTHLPPQGGAEAYARFDFDGVEVVEGMQLPRVITCILGDCTSVFESRKLRIRSADLGEEVPAATPMFLPEPEIVREGVIGSIGHRVRAGMEISQN